MESVLMHFLQHIEKAGHIFFALAISGLGIVHIYLREFVTGRAPAWPEGIPGEVSWAFASGIFLIVTGIAIITSKKAKGFLLGTCALIFLMAFLRHIPVLAADSFLAPSWTNAGKALVFCGGAMALAALYPDSKSRYTSSFINNILNRRKEFIITGQICLGLFLLITGVQHFMYTDFVASLIPVWFPGNAVFWTHFGGAALISGGFGLLIPYTASLAALMSGIMVFSWFWIIHIPRSFAGVSDGIAVFEALAVSGIAFAIASHWFQNKAHT